MAGNYHSIRHKEGFVEVLGFFLIYYKVAVMLLIQTLGSLHQHLAISPTEMLGGSWPPWLHRSKPLLPFIGRKHGPC